MEVHSIRLLFYDGRQFSPTEEVRKAFLWNSNSFEVHSFLEIRHSACGHVILTRWRGLEKSSATWEDVLHMVEDVPHLLKKFLIKSIKKGDTISQEVYELYLCLLMRPISLLISILLFFITHLITMASILHSLLTGVRRNFQS